MTPNKKIKAISQIRLKSLLFQKDFRWELYFLRSLAREHKIQSAIIEPEICAAANSSLEI